MVRLHISRLNVSAGVPEAVFCRLPVRPRCVGDQYDFILVPIDNG